MIEALLRPIVWARNVFFNGVYVGGQAAENLLNLVQFGTWTVVVSTDGTAPTGVTTSTNTAFYARFGPWFFFFFDVVVSNWGGSPTGNVTYSLPFASGYFVPVLTTNATGFGAGPVRGQTFNNSARIVLFSDAAGTSTVTAAHMSGNENLRAMGFSRLAA